MKVVLDTNVLVAAFATRGACSELFSRVLAAHEYAVDANLEGEVVRVLRGKFHVPPEHLETVRALFASTAVRIQAQPLGAPACRDPDDDRILALARSFGARAIVTGDEDLLILHPWEGIDIVRPREFWELDRQGALRR